MDQMVLKRSKVTILSCKYSRILFLSDALEKTKTWPSKSLDAVILVMKSTLKNLNFMQHNILSYVRVQEYGQSLSERQILSLSAHSDDFWTENFG